MHGQYETCKIDGAEPRQRFWKNLYKLTKSKSIPFFIFQFSTKKIITEIDQLNWEQQKDRNLIF